MTTTETKRIELREGLRDVLEEEHVTTLMDSLPPMDWHELATKTDLAALEERLDTRFERIDTRFDAVSTRFDAVSTRFDAVSTRFETVEARIDKGLAKQTYVILAGAAAIAAPFYIALFIALFTGGAG